MLHRYKITLSQMGFGSIPTNTTYQVGDIVIINKTGPHPHGHICIFHTNGWVSDFRQRGWNVYGAGQTHSLWRDRRFLNGATASGGPISNSGGFGVSSGGGVEFAAATSFICRVVARATGGSDNALVILAESRECG